VDVDLLPKGDPQYGYPKTPEQFRDDYRRLELNLPIDVVPRNGLPSIQIDDPEFQQDLIEWRARRAKRLKNQEAKEPGKLSLFEGFTELLRVSQRDKVSVSALG
jgi:hypothetical protein